MKPTRRLGGSQLAVLPRHYDQEVTRHTGSHMRLIATLGGEPHITISRHKSFGWRHLVLCLEM